MSLFVEKTKFDVDGKHMPMIIRSSSERLIADKFGRLSVIPPAFCSRESKVTKRIYQHVSLETSRLFRR